MLGFEYKPTISTQNVRTRLEMRGFYANMTDDALVAFVRNQSPEDVSRLLNELGHAASLETIEHDLSSQEIRRGQLGGQSSLRSLVAHWHRNGYTAQQINNLLKDALLGQTITTHPTQGQTPREEALQTQWATLRERQRKLAQLIGDAPTADRHGRPYTAQQLGAFAERQRAYRAEFTQITNQLHTLENGLMNEPLHNIDAPSGRAEAELMLDPMERSLRAQAQSLAKFRRATVHYFPELFDFNSNLFKNQVFERTAWLLRDNDRNLKLNPADVMSIAEKETLIGLRVNAQALQRLAQSNNAALAKQARNLLARLAATAAEQGFTPQDLGIDIEAGRARAFANEEAYVNEISKLRRTLGPVNTRLFWRLENAISLAQVSRLKLTNGEARQNGAVLNELIDAIGDQLGHRNLSRMGAEQQRTIFETLINKQSDFDWAKLKASTADSQEATRMVEWLEQYKTLRERRGPSALKRIVIAENTSLNQILGLRVLLEKVGIETTQPNGVKVVPLVESAEDSRFVRGMLNTLKDKASRTLYFPLGEEVMQATSDMDRVEGGFFSKFTNFSFQYHAKRILGRAFIVYPGTGGTSQRFGSQFASQMVRSMINGLNRWRHTLQGEQVHREYRTQNLANYRTDEFLASFLARASGVGDTNHVDDRVTHTLAMGHRQFYRGFVTQAGTSFDHYLNILTATPYEPALNRGSRSGAGNVSSLAFKKWVRHATSRAISLASGTKTAGTPATFFGVGLSTRDWLDVHPDGLNILHQRYRSSQQVRANYRTLLKATLDMDARLQRAIFHPELETSAELRMIHEKFVADQALIRQYLPQIIDGPGSTRTLEQLLPHPGRDLMRWARTVALTSMQHLNTLNPKTALMSRGQRTRAGRTLSIMLNGISALARLGRSTG